jgi:peroxiredoxin
VTTRAVFVALLMLAACSPRGEAAPESAIPFELKRLDGTSVRTEDLRGRYVLLDFWATWCPPCVLEIPELRAVHEGYRDRGVDILAISVDNLEPAELQEWLDENGVTYPVVIGTEELARRYGAFGFPFHVLISPEGTIVDRLTPGFHDRDELGRLLEQHLRG